MTVSASVLGNRRPDTVVAVPQWQGSGSGDPRRLADGTGLRALMVMAPGLVPPRRLSPGRTALVGTRALDPMAEEESDLGVHAPLPPLT